MAVAYEFLGNGEALGGGAAAKLRKLALDGLLLLMGLGGDAGVDDYTWGRDASHGTSALLSWAEDQRVQKALHSLGNVWGQTKLAGGKLRVHEALLRQQQR